MALAAGCSAGQAPVPATSAAQTSATVATETATTRAAAASTPPRNEADAGTDGQAAFLANDAAGAVFLRWTRTGSALQLTFDSSAAATSVVGGHSSGFGTIDADGNVALTLGTQTWTGVLDGTVLTLHVPASDGSLTTITMRAASIGQYNDAVAALHAGVEARASASAAAAAIERANKAVRDADGVLGAALNAIATRTGYLADSYDFSYDLSSISDDLDVMNDDLVVLRKDASNGDCDVARDDATGIGDDLTGMTDSIVGLEETITGTMDDIANVQSAFDDADDALAALAAALANDAAAGGFAFGSHGQGDVTAAKRNAKSEIAKATAAVTAARATAAGFLKKGESVLATATSVATDCS
ncbi:MAG: hypothetical protein JWM93_1880 [Frankiales bacterium]|nr:hypothetical protein [Frankiales bacterium]